MNARREEPVDAQTLDLRHIWHPFTQERDVPPIEIVAGEGTELVAADGRRYLDMISSWWVNLHGHGHPFIAAAIARQAARLEHVIFADFTHRPAAQLASHLSELAPAGLSRVFFSDNGSTAVEVALKLALQYWRNRGEPGRRKFAAFSGGYHGDTAGAMSVGASSGFFAPYADLLFGVRFLPWPATWDGDNEAEEKEAAALAEIDRHLEAEGGETAAIIVEPLVQGASGMRMCRPEFLRALVARARAAGALVIFDEVMTGFGRTGAMFASLSAGVAPDLLCLSKGLTGGFLPLAATLCGEEIYATFEGGFARAFSHGHSYTANPLGCAAALASLDLFERENTLEKIAAIAERHRGFLDQLAAHPRVRRRRLTGTIAAFDVAGAEEGYAAAVGRTLKRHFLARGLLIRPLGNVVYLMPPYCATPEELDRAYRGIREVLDLV